MKPKMKSKSRKKITWKKIREFFGLLKVNWKTKYRMIIRNETTHQDKLTLRLSPKNVFVVGVMAAVALIVLTAMLIAFTPLRVYVPGYTTPDEYRLYKRMAHRVDSLNNLFQINQQYYDNLERILKDKPMPYEEEELTAETAQDAENEVFISTPENKKADAEIRAEAAKLLANQGTAALPNTQNQPLSARAGLNSLNFMSPLRGVIITDFAPDRNHYGIDIQAKKGDVVCCVAGGVIVYTGFDAALGYVVVVQHAGNVLSVYKRNAKLLKKEGYIVTAGEPLAQVGSSGLSETGNHLHFEMWYNGYPVNPLHYLVLE
jgi:murein DD-endopeptidase MepM/ murein hydrolase activator NlpD